MQLVSNPGPIKSVELFPFTPTEAGSKPSYLQLSKSANIYFKYTYSNSFKNGIESPDILYYIKVFPHMGVDKEM